MDNYLGRKVNKENSSVKGLINKITSYLLYVVDLIKDFRKKGSDKLKEYANSGFERLKSPSNQSLDYLKELKNPTDFFTIKCEVPLFVIPIGKNPNDYIISLDFRKYEIASRDSYKLPVPRITFYAAYPPGYFHKKILQDSVIKAFTEYFHEAIKRISKEQEAAKKVEQETKTTPLSENQNESNTFINRISAIGTVVIAMIVATNPIIDLLLLLVALGGSGMVMRELLVKLKAEIANKMSSKTSEVDQSFEKDRKTLEAKEEIVRQAISKSMLRIHPALVALKLLIQGKAKSTDEKKKIIDTTIRSKPSIVPFIKNQAYFSVVPSDIKGDIFYIISHIRV